MILFSAEAILASSTSKFGIEIPRIDDEDLNSCTESTNSTPLIHCIASVGNCEQVHTSVLNPPPLKMTESLADGPDWHLRSWFCSGLSLFSVVDIWSGSSMVFSHGFNSWGWGAVEEAGEICKKVFRYTRCIPNVWQPFFAARRYEWRPQQYFKDRMFRE